MGDEYFELKRDVLCRHSVKCVKTVKCVFEVLEKCKQSLINIVHSIYIVQEDQAI